MKKYYFIAGLPRSGSTLLSALLNQNPKFYSGPSSPVTGIMLSLENYVPNDELYKAYPKPQQIGQLISNVINYFYSDIDKPVVFDKNRSWVNRVHYIPGYFNTEAKIICPVRNIDEILASFIAMHKRNPYEVNGRINFLDEMLIKNNILLNDENRCKMLMDQQWGIVGQSYFGIKDALMKGYEKSIHFVEYNDLINKPQETMDKIYDFLDEPYFKHTFDNIKNTMQEDDAQTYGFADMHTVRDTLNKRKIDPIELLPKNVYDSCQGLEYWRDLNQEIPNEDNEESNLIGI